MRLSHAITRALRASIATAAAGAAVFVGVIAPATAAPQAATAGIRNAGGPTAIPGSYLVVLKDATVSKARVSSTVASLTARYGGTVGHRYTTALRGFSVRASEATARLMAADPAVAYVEQDHRTRALDATQLNPPSWGLDRIDQRNRPVDNSYTYPSNGGSGVRAYVIDSGLRTTHQDIAGRAFSGVDLVDGGAADDCYGHGTHVAGTVGGTAHGVAKNVTLIGVRVFDCQGFGDMSTTVAAIDWVAANAVRPAVTNMSLGYMRTSDTADTIGTATRGLIATGVSVVVSAGNNGSNACDKTPAYVAAALTVGNTWSDDGAAGLSNEGSCVDLFAPGQLILSLHHTSDTATGVRDGTSMSAPHVAGAAALLLSANPTWTPAQVHSAIVANATTGVVTSLDDPASPNRLLYVPPS